MLGLTVIMRVVMNVHQYSGRGCILAMMIAAAAAATTVSCDGNVEICSCVTDSCWSVVQCNHLTYRLQDEL